ncbi:MAG TPA: CHAD domain-containing protein [Candidatus Angelobacter sp.]|nr:CHAD domain-containing protein [Candidatus Angelobacter sp.]
MKKSGLGYWMREVLRQADNASATFAPDPVHDLRVALRRCRSLAEGLQAIDPDPAWKKMRKEGKQLFANLGSLRDCQVMMEWIEKLGATDDPVAQRLMSYCKNQEQSSKAEAAQALQDFNRKQWENSIEFLSRRSTLLPAGGPPFQCLALEGWQEARKLHSIALKTRNKEGLHRLRIGVKKFRYLVENFLPQIYRQWAEGLKGIQDLLGEIHDLDVLWDVALGAGVFETVEDRRRWSETIEAQRKQRVEKYRETMLGKHSLWQLWREGLPQGEEAADAVFAKLQSWASFLDEDIQHTRRVTRLSLQLHDGLVRVGVLAMEEPGSRNLLRAAAITHDVGDGETGADRRKNTQRLVRKLHLPFGWNLEDLETTALVARYHRGPLPGTQKRFLALTDQAQRRTKVLAGILRLADAFDRNHQGKVVRLKISRTGDFVTIQAVGLDEHSPLMQKIAGARHLLETTCNVPMIVRPLSL